MEKLIQIAEDFDEKIYIKKLAAKLKEYEQLYEKQKRLGEIQGSPAVASSPKTIPSGVISSQPIAPPVGLNPPGGATS